MEVQVTSVNLMKDHGPCGKIMVLTSMVLAGLGARRNPKVGCLAPEPTKALHHPALHRNPMVQGGTL